MPPRLACSSQVPARSSSVWTLDVVVLSFLCCHEWGVYLRAHLPTVVGMPGSQARMPVLQGMGKWTWGFLWPSGNRCAAARVISDPKGLETLM